MKIAVTCQNNQVFQHFGHTPSFALYEISEGLISANSELPTGDSGHGALAGLLKTHGVDLLLCGGIGGGAIQALTEAGIQVIGGVSGDVDEAVGAYLGGTLKADPDFRCNHHHEHEHGHEHGDGHGDGKCRCSGH